MKKKLASLMLALVMCLSLLPATASAAEADLPDWYFLFAAFKNIDTDVVDGDGTLHHATYSMPQEEVDLIRDLAVEFEEYMNSLGIMRAHVEVVEIDETLTELSESSTGSYASQIQATPLLENKVDLDRYDHVTCFLDLTVRTGYAGKAPSPFENGTGISCINLRSWEYFKANYDSLTGQNVWHVQVYSHEFIHFTEYLSRKWGVDFDEHYIGNNFYTPTQDEWKTVNTDMYLNRAKGDGGTGVPPIVWQYPPHVMRTMTELTIPSWVTSIGDRAFWGLNALTRVTIPTSVTNVGYAAFWDTGVKDVYYAGTEAQWNAIQIGEYNGKLTGAAIHYNHLLADVKTTDYFAEPVAWALDKGITTGTGNGNFSPNANCTTAQILTFLWRANGSPKPAGSNPFSDVKSSDFYADAAVWAYENGLVSGGTLNGNAPCTRSAAVMYMWKAAGSPSAKAASFSDVSANADYAQAVAWAVEQGITTGIGNNQFGPDAACTRGQIVTFLYRCLA